MAIVNEGYSGLLLAWEVVLLAATGEAIEVEIFELLEVMGRWKIL